MEKKQLEALLADMSLEEKTGQLVQLMGMFYESGAEGVLTGPWRNMGLTEESVWLAGSILGTYGAQTLKRIQASYMAHHPHHIPLLFMMDVIHGMKTIFPAPLAQAASFEPELTEKCAAAAAKEAAVSGLHVTFSPMADLSRDARWGRVVESCGEDPYLIGRFTEAQVKGFQGTDMKESGHLCSCVKHFAGYGAAVAGRDYNTAEFSERSFREFYLKGYEAGIRAGAGMVMTSFNTVNGIPASANRALMRDMLRGELGFDGVLISDFAAIRETVVHGLSADEAEAAKNCLETGVDIDMMTGVYAGNLPKLIKEGALDEKLLDESVMRVLELKNRLGLFENPYKDADEALEKEVILCPEHRTLAREAAAKSMVLLENSGILPLDTSKKIAFIGPYTDRKELNSSWAVTGDAKDCVTIREAAREVLDDVRTTYLDGCPILDPGYARNAFRTDTKEEISDRKRKQLMREAVKAAREADTVVLMLGEHYRETGEAASRAMLELPDVQTELLLRIAEVNPHVVVVLFCGRPLDLRMVSGVAEAVLVAWLPGTEGGHAVMDVLTGKVNPSGKLPMSFPYCVGQEPIYYNAYSTGRPDDPASGDKFRSRYIDVPNEPLYPFGYGMSYTKFGIGPVTLETAGSADGPEAAVLDHDGVLTASAQVYNIGECAGTETMQLYLQDVSASVVRPVRELKGFEKVTLAPGESRTVSFRIDESMLRFLRADGTVGSEPGLFRVWIADCSASNLGAAEFQLI